jgi:hypothetical protein
VLRLRIVGSTVGVAEPRPWSVRRLQRGASGRRVVADLVGRPLVVDLTIGAATGHRVERAAPSSRRRREGARLRTVVSSTDDAPDLDAFVAEADDVIASNRYLTLSTVDPSGRPWANPVYFSPDGRGRFLWVSSPTARHSRNLASRPDVALVVFDSTVGFGEARAFYAAGHAGLVPEERIDAAAARFNERLVGLGGTAVDDLASPGPLRLYEVVVTEASVLLRGSDPRNADGIDTRVEIPLLPPPR